MKADNAIEYRLDESLFLGETQQRYVKVCKMDVLYMRAKGSWVDVITTRRTYRLSTHLGNLTTQLDDAFFFRISRSYVVNLHRIDAVEGYNLTVANQTLTMARYV